MRAGRFTCGVVERRRSEMQWINQNPSELYYQRHEELVREARNAHLARSLRAARREEHHHDGRRRTAGPVRQAISLWGRTFVPFFRA
jgi:hypothetical protein